MVNVDEGLAMLERISAGRNPVRFGAVGGDEHIRLDSLRRLEDSFGGEEGRKIFGRLFGQDAERLETVVAQNGDGRAERCDGVAVRPHVHCHENSLRSAERGEKRGVHHFSSSSSRRMLRTRSPSSRLRSAVKRRTGVYLSTIVFAMRF